MSTSRNRAPATDDERVIEHFYGWEVRGRGWLLCDVPVRLEPPFRPFFGHPSAVATTRDDSRRHTLLSGALHLLHRLIRHRPPRAALARSGRAEDEPDPELSVESGNIVELQLSLPPELKVTPERSEQLLLSLSAAYGPIAFELIGTPDAVVVQLACDAGDASLLRSQLAAHFPQAVVTPAQGQLETAWCAAGDEETAVAECGLAREFMLPLGVHGSFATDPLAALIGALADVGPEEVAVLQILFEPVRHPWAESILRSVTFTDGTALFTGGRDLVGQAKAKVDRPLYAAVVRVAGRSAEGGRAAALARSVVAGLSVFADPQGNELFPLDNEDYPADAHVADLLLRRSRRAGMLLNTDELVSLLHLPSSDVHVPKLRPPVRRSKPAPASVLGHDTVLGVNEHAGQRREVTLSPAQRGRHTHVIGASGTGKSTLLLNLIAQDLANGDGLALLDPHGDLVDAVLRHVPTDRLHDVILLDPADEEYPVGFNVLSAHSAVEKNLLASDLVAVFRRLSTSWGDQMNAVLGNAILAFLENPRGGTLVDLRRFLVEPAFRKQYLREVHDQEVVYYWAKDFPLLTGRPQGPVLTRLDTFLRPKPIRHMVAQLDSRLDFGDILDNGKILLARLSHGAIGAENAYLLGTLLVSKLHQLALGRQRVREEERRWFWLYIDEFHHFATPSMASVLSGVRKYRLGLVLAHQELQQLDGVPEVSSAVLSNPYVRVCFRLGDQDARKLESGFATFKAPDLQDLGTGEAICRVERAEFDFNLRTAVPHAVDEGRARAVHDEVVRRSRERYAVPRAVVEAALDRSRGGAASGGGEDAGDAEPQLSSAASAEPRDGTGPRVRGGGSATAEAVSSPASAQSVVPSRPVEMPAEAAAGPREDSADTRESRTDQVSVPTGAATDRSTPNSAIQRIDPPHPSTTTSAPGQGPQVKGNPPAQKAALGRGGARHQQLQKLVKQWAEGMGYRATIEGQVLGVRAADVALEKGEVSIACEFCVTTAFVHELGNVRKCLDAGFTYVAAVSPDPQRLAKLREVVEQQLDDAELERVRFCTPDELLAFVRELETPEGGEGKSVRGYRVKTTFRPVAPAEGNAREQAVSQVVARSIKRLRDGSKKQ